MLVILNNSVLSDEGFLLQRSEMLIGTKSKKLPRAPEERNKGINVLDIAHLRSAPFLFAFVLLTYCPSGAVLKGLQ